MSPPYEITVPIHIYIEKLIRLHELIAQGDERGDSQEADDLREDLMDISNRDLTKEDREWVENLSGDLYLLSGKDMYYKVDNRAAELLFLQDDVQQKNWLKVLEHSRKSLGLSQREVALYRAMAWQDRSQRVAELFKKFAEEHQ